MIKRIDTQKSPIEPVRMIDGFTQKSYAALSALHKEQGLAMSLDDLVFVQSYFRGQRREPTYTELKVIDAYWSCRHVTFTTALKTKIKSNNPHIAQAYADYTELFNRLYNGRDDKYPSLMDVATIGAKVLREKGFTQSPAQDISQENSACAITQDIVKRDGTVEPWYILFKNETHSSASDDPLSGAVLDTLSDRAYVYQAMRVSGGADVDARSAKEFSSYADRICVPVGEAREYYHSGYAAQRLDTSFVVGGAPQSNVVRETPRAGDLAVIIGGEVDNAATTRKLQRLMLNGEFTRLIKRGKGISAGGVAVAVGELSSGVDIELSAIPTTCAVRSATELAISQCGGIAAVIDAADLDEVLELCHGENADVAVIANVTDADRMRMFLNGNMIVDLERRFLDSNGVRREATALIKDPKVNYFGFFSRKRDSMHAKGDYTGLMCDILSAPDVCSQKNLTETFDSTVGGNSVFMPLGGKKQLTPTEVTAAKIPADTDMCTVCSHGLSAVLPSSPFMGGMYSVILAVEKLAAAGVRLDHIYLSLQEFFGRTADAEKWGAPMSATLGALTAQLNLKRAAIGVGDCMTATSDKLNVPPTLIAFGLGVADSAVIVDNTFKAKGERVYRYRLKRDEYGVPDFDNLCDFLMLLAGEIGRQNVTAAAVVERGGAAATVVKSCFGNGLGFAFASTDRNLFEESEGDLIFAARMGDDFFGYDLDFLGLTTDEPDFLFGASITRTADGTDMAYDGKKADGGKLTDSFTRTFVVPTTANTAGVVYNADYAGKGGKRKKAKAKPQGGVKVFIPVFDGTNGEIEIARKFERAGAQPQIFVVRNRNKNDIEQCIKAMAASIKESNILALADGGTMAALLSNDEIAEAVENMLYKRDGLAIGLGGGFNAMVKCGLLPSGHIHTPTITDPVLSFNRIGRHVSMLADIRVCSTFSPWLKHLSVGDVYQVPTYVECKLMADSDAIQALVSSGQIATQYCDFDGNATMASSFNPSGSVLAIEGIVSPDGRVLGKTGHSARTGEFLLKNTVEYYAKSDMRLFEAGVKYFK